MKRLVIALVLIGSILGALAIVEWRGVATQAAAQAVTPAPGRHSEVRAAFAFLVKDAPNQMGWRSAEYKDEYGQKFYKADVAPGCGEWQTVGGDARPGLLLTPGGATCPGFVIAFGALYWFSAPPMATPSPNLPTLTATVVPPPPMGATATPSPTVASGATATPSPQGEATPTRTATPSTTGTPRILYGNMCRPDPTPEYPHSITIYGQGGLTAPAMFWYCVPSVTPDAVFIVPEATFRAAYDNGPRKMLEDLGR